MRILLALAVLLAALRPLAAAGIEPRNSARYAGDGRWEWTVYIEAAPEILRRIGCVEYTLHPTFRDPVQRVCEIGDAEQPFGLTRHGWGTFQIPIRVEMRNGEVVQLTHMLRFEAPEARLAAPVRIDNVADQIGRRLWRWTAFVEADPEMLRRIRCVEYTLHPTFYDPVREVCVRGDDRRAFALTAEGWGTFEIKARIFFDDGSVRETSHHLRF